jgi:hypothetical protein
MQSVRSPLAVAILVIFVMSLTGCTKEESNQPTPAVGGGFNPPSGSGLTYSPPADWQAEKPASSMRRAQYRLTREVGDPEDAEMVVFFFPGQGGSVQANLDRWVSMFSRADGSEIGDQAKIDRKEFNGVPVTVVDVEGQYTNSSMGSMGGSQQPKPDYRMLAAIVETSGGPWFFKLTGPTRTVEKWEQSFETFLRTVRIG